jgi:hypothetical protein
LYPRNKSVIQQQWKYSLKLVTILWLENIYPEDFEVSTSIKEKLPLKFHKLFIFTIDLRTSPIFIMIKVNFHIDYFEESIWVKKEWKLHHSKKHWNWKHQLVHQSIKSKWKFNVNLKILKWFKGNMFSLRL